MEKLEYWLERWGTPLFVALMLLWGLGALIWIVVLREENGQMKVWLQGTIGQIAQLEKQTAKQAIVVQPIKLKRIPLTLEGKPLSYLEQYRFDVDIDSEAWRASYLVFCRTHPNLHVMQVRAEPEWREEELPTHVVLTVRERK